MIVVAVVLVGVWTDGTWVFSTGLDQRVRCWVVEEHGTPKAVAHFITNVPEPEALDVRAFDRLVMLQIHFL